MTAAAGRELTVIRADRTQDPGQTVVEPVQIWR